MKMKSLLSSILSFLCLICVAANAQTSHTLPTLDRNNNWTGLNTYVLGNLQLGTVNQTCPSPGTYMTGFTDTFVPICQSLSALGVVSINGTAGAITLAGGTNITVVQSPSGTFTFNCPSCNTATGVVTLNTLSGAVTLTAGSGISITQTSSSNLTITNTGGGGGGGSGTVSAGGPYQIPQYDPTTNTQINPVSTLYSLNSSMTLSQINTLIASINCGSCQAPIGGQGTVIVPDGVLQQGWTNTTSNTGTGNPGISIEDIRLGARTTPLSTWGVACGVRTQGGFVMTQGSTDVTPSGTTFYATDVGSTVVITTTISGIPTRFMATVSAFTSSGQHLTLSTPAPATGTFSGMIGFLSTTNFQNAMSGMQEGNLVGQVPAGCGIMTGPVNWTAGQSIIGQASGNSTIYGLPGADILVNPDSSGSGSVTRGGLVFGHLAMVVSDSIDATKPWNSIGPDGTVINETPLYRPVGTNSPAANNSLGPGWAQGPGVNNGGATNGVASITQNSAVICVPTSLGRMPVVGQQIVFRDTPIIFKSTISSLAGSGCSTGFSPATMSSPLPNTSGYTIAQAEWVSTVSIQNLAVAMTAGTINYPLTVTLSNSSAINPSYEVNFATHGRVKIGSEEYDYLGASSTSPYTIVLRDGPTSTVGWAIGTAIIPENPCYTKYETPWPVTPTVNSGDSTPSGAVYFPAWCIGNAAIAMPQANANIYAGTGFSNAYIQDVIIAAANNSLTNNVAGYYVGGNNASYGTTYERMAVNGTEYGIVQGPASVGQHGVSNVKPTGDGNHYRDLTLRNAVNLVVDQIENSTIDRIDAYTSFTSPYDNTVVGSYTAFGLGLTLDEQTGSTVSGSYQLLINNINSEPENGTHAENPVYAYLDCINCEYHNDSFEGVPTIIGGSNQLIEGGQLSPPSVNYGFNNVIRFVTMSSSNDLSAPSKGYSFNGITNFGSELNMTAQIGSGQPGPNLWGASFTRASIDGQNDQFAYMGNFAAPPVATWGTMIYPDEFVTNNPSLESNPMSIGSTFDLTALVTGQYTACLLGNGTGQKTSCNTTHFDGSSNIFIGSQNRIPADQTLLSMMVRTPSGAQASAASLRINTISSGSCTGAQLTNFNVGTTSTSWTPIEIPVNFTGYAGCNLGIQMAWTGNNNEVDFQYFDFLPLPTRILLRNATFTTGTTCAVNGEFLGSDTTNLYMCENGAVANLPFGGGGGGGITAGTGDTTFSGTGTVATTTGNINGGTPFKSQAAGPECNNGTAGQLNVCTNITIAGPFASGIYTVPSSATPVFDISQGNTQILTLSANTTTTMTGGTTRGEDVNFEVFQPASGGPYTFAWPSNFFGFPAVQSVAGGYTSARGFWDGTNMVADGYNSTLCVSGASPAVCGNATKGFVAIPAGSSPTLVVNTTAVGATSVIIPIGDESITIPGVTCSGSTLSGPLVTTARTAGTSFTLSAPGTVSGGSYCVGYAIVNP